MTRRAVASRPPFNGAPAETSGVFTGIILQSKPALTQRLPILKEGLLPPALTYVVFYSKAPCWHLAANSIHHHVRLI